MAELLSQMSTRVLKEPLGFIRVVQFPMVILAFATTAGYSALLKVNYKCNESQGNFQLSWYYPFDLLNYQMPKDFCAPEKGGFTLFGEGAVSQSQFFVCTGILSFLYVTSILLIYLFQLEKYETNSRYPMIDLMLTAVLAFFWFVSSCAWAAGVTALKSITSQERVQASINQYVATCAPTNKCSYECDWNFGSLNVSLIAGFACFFLFASNLWFVWKETEWFKSRQASMGAGMGAVPGSAGGMPSYSGPQ